MIRTGVFATDPEISLLQALAQTSGLRVSGGDPASEDPLKASHRMAIAHGLPEIPGYYGCDLHNGEFLKTPSN